MDDRACGDVVRLTAAHIRRVGELMVEMASQLMTRAVNHDESKWSPEEWEAFASETPLLRDMTYGSPEYKAALERLGPALKHHYNTNRHHPEHHARGISGMNLLDLIEMLADWKAATERHADGSIERSLENNTARFSIDPAVRVILENTIRDMKWGFDYPKGYEERELGGSPPAV